MRKYKKFRHCCCPWDQDKELTVLLMWCPGVKAKGFQAFSRPRKGRKEVSATQLHHYCPKGSPCQILAVKGKSTKFFHLQPQSFSNKRAKDYCHPCSLICLCNYLYIYTNLISACICKQKHMCESGTLLLPFKLSERWEPSWEFHPALLLTSLTEIFRNRAQNCCMFTTCWKTWLFTQSLITDSLQWTSLDNIFASVQKDSWRSWILLRVHSFPQPVLLSKAKAVPHFTVPSQDREAAPAADPGAAQHICTPHFLTSTDTLSAWHLGLHGTPFDLTSTLLNDIYLWKGSAK